MFYGAPSDGSVCVAGRTGRSPAHVLLNRTRERRRVRSLRLVRHEPPRPRPARTGSPHATRSATSGTSAILITDGSPPPTPTRPAAPPGLRGVPPPVTAPERNGLQLEPDNPCFLNAAAASKAAKKKEADAKALAKKLAAAAKKAAAASARAQKAAETVRARAGGGLPPARARSFVPAPLARPTDRVGVPRPSAPNSFPTVGERAPSTAPTPSSSTALPVWPAAASTTTPVGAPMELVPAAAPPSLPPSASTARVPRSPTEDDVAAVAARAAAAAVLDASTPPDSSELLGGGSRATQQCSCTIARMEKRVLDRLDEVEAADKKRMVAFGKRVTAVRLDRTSTKSQVVAIKTGMTGMRQSTNAISTAVSRGAVAMRDLAAVIELRGAGGGSASNGAIVPVPSNTASLSDTPRVAPWTKPMVVRYLSSAQSFCIVRCVNCADGRMHQLTPTTIPLVPRAAARCVPVA